MYKFELPKLHNNFKIIMTDVRTGKRSEIAKAENIVLDTFRTRFLNRQNCTPHGISLGTGSATPSVTDTALQNQIITMDTEFTATTIGDTITLNGTIHIAANQLNGNAISEIGIRNYTWVNGYEYWQVNDLLTRALLQDSNGNPIVIAKTDMMTLDIYATAYMVIPKMISGYKCINKMGWDSKAGFPSFIGDTIKFNQVRVDKDWSEFNPVARNDSFNGSVSSSLDAETKTRTYTVSEIPTTNGNIGGIRSVLLGGVLEMEVPNESFTQSIITKEVVGTGDGVNNKFDTKFGWIRNNGTCKVYVNDVEQIGVSINYDCPPKSLSSNYFYKVEGQEYALSANWAQSTGLLDRIIVEKKINKPLLRVNALASPTFPDGSHIGCSNDLTTWTPLALNTDIPEVYRDYKYWRIYSTKPEYIMGNNDATLDTPPAAGSVVAITYQPDCIAKDENKVLRNMTYKLGM